MKIKSNASPAELSSPFFTLNEEFCSEFESYIASKNGKVKGKYNAWSFLIFGKTPHPKPWDVMYKKSTFTTNGNLLMSSKYQSLLALAEWETERKGTHDSEFEIRKKTTADILKIPLSKSVSKLEVSGKYVMCSKGKKPKFFLQLIDILTPLFISEEIYRIEYLNNKLRIELRSEHHHFNILDQLIEL
ncbi:hypothetical protein [Winogradskyella sp.]|uniref:hypothetical protein n=1 Tax=Winogradskyella sp. TaxID=1883156 RepID=UPI0025E820B7|nr:hypothetical protein [Winogradskyella sp.]